jgi:hypothetical protein
MSAVFLWSAVHAIVRDLFRTPACRAIQFAPVSYVGIGSPQPELTS